MADISSIKLPSGNTYDVKDILGRQSIPYGIVTSDSTTVFTATVDGVTQLSNGVCCLIRNNNKQTSASGWTLNVNDLGAKPVYNNMADATRDTTIFNKVYTMLFVYDEDRVDGGCWICYRGYNSDNNTIGYQIRHNSSTLNVTQKTYRYRLLFSGVSLNTLVPANASTSTSSTAEKAVNSTPINPFGPIYYYGYTSAVSANASPSAVYLWQQYAVNLGYSFTNATALDLTSKLPVFLKCAPQNNGSAIIDSTEPIVQALPSNADGKIYILLGIAYSATNLELCIEHPVFYCDGTAIRVWTGASGSSSVDWDDVTNKPTFATVATSGDYDDLSNKPTIPSAVTESTVAGWGFTKNTGTYSKPSGGIPKTDLASAVQTSLGKADTALQSYTETDPTVPSWAKASSKPTYTASEVGALPDTTAIPTNTSDLTNDSGFITGMTILSYGNSTWADFEAAYNANKIVYCRASSNANPASGSQTRLAFMAYVNNETTPTNVEFQYYRSMSSHTASQQGDQVFVYKLDKTSGWSVTTREASVKVVAGDGLGGTYSNGTMTLTGPTKVSDLTNDSGFIDDLTDLGITATATELNYTDGVTSNIQDQLDAMAKAVSYTASGAIASFVDGEGDKAFVDLVANIEPKQDLTYGDPYPAGGGKNKFYSSISNSATLNGVTCSFDANTQTFTINGANESSSAYILLSVTPTEDIVRNVALSRAFIGAPTGVYINLVYNDGSWHGINNGETLPDSVSIENVRIQVGILGTAGSFTTTTFKCQLQEGSSAPASWTPYENICPISGWTECNVTRAGKNIADKNIFDINKPSWSTAQYWIGLSENADGTYTLTRPIGWGGHGFVYIGTYPAGTYTVSFDLKSTASVTCGAILRAYNTKTWVTNVQTDKSGMSTTGRKSMSTITTTAICDFWLAVGPYTNNGAQVISGDYQVEVGKTATAYEPYQGTTLAIDWTTEAGTVYGGTIDVATGLLTVDAMLEVFDELPSGNDGIQSQIDYCLPSTGVSTVGDYTRISFGIRSDIQRSDYNLISSSYSYKMCNMLKHYFAYNDESSHWYRNTSLYAFFPSSLVGTTATSVINYLKSIKDTNPLSFWVPLAHPQTYQLTPQEVLHTLLGTNNVWADTGNTTVRYIDVDSDLSDYFVEKSTYKSGQLLQDRNLAYVESGTKASRAYSANNYFVNADGALCRITASVSSGGMLIKGANYIVVTGGLASEFVTALGDVETLLASI